MINGIGIDIIEISRIKEAVEKHGNNFLAKIYTENELNYCRNQKNFKFPELAARFAAKEAYSKAIGTGMAGFNWKEIEISNNHHGKPSILLKGKRMGKVHVSLSHSRDYAVASVYVEK